MADNVTVQINIANGEVLIQSPPEYLDTIFTRLETFLPNMLLEQSKLVSASGDKSIDEQGESREELPSSDFNDSTATPSHGAKRKRSATSKKPESYKSVDLGLDEKQRVEFRDFYKSKSPKSQNEQILVIMYWLKNSGKKDAVTKEEIYTALRTVDAKIPARISSVLSNLGIEGRITSDENGYHLHHTGEDFVKFDLPKTEGK